MPRPKPKTHPSLISWCSPSKITRRQMGEVLDRLNLSQEGHTETCHLVLKGITKALGLYYGMERNEAAEPTPASRAGELRQLPPVFKQLRQKLRLSEYAKRDLEQAKMLYVGQLERDYTANDFMEKEIIREALTEIYSTLAIIERNVVMALKNLDAQESRRAKHRVAFHTLVLSLGSIFDKHFQPDLDPGSDLQQHSLKQDFIRYIAKSSKIPCPKNLQRYM